MSSSISTSGAKCDPIDDEIADIIAVARQV